MSKPISNLNSALDYLAKQAPGLDVAVSEAQARQFRIFLSELCEYNLHTNLVSSSDPEVIVKEHVLDSISLIAALKSIGADRGLLVDIGSGGGFPAIVLAIMLNELKVCLVESVAKKTRFLKSVVEALGLADRVEIKTERSESLAGRGMLRGCFDAATARAIGKIDLVAELALPLVKKGGWLLVQKSRAQLEEESGRAARALPVLGGEVRDVFAPNPAVLGKEHVVFMIEKIADSPDQFPRPTAQMKRSPLGGL